MFSAATSLFPVNIWRNLHYTNPYLNTIKRQFLYVVLVSDLFLMPVQRWLGRNGTYVNSVGPDWLYKLGFVLCQYAQAGLRHRWIREFKIFHPVQHSSIENVRRFIYCRGFPNTSDVKCWRQREVTRLRLWTVFKFGARVYDSSRQTVWCGSAVCCLAN